MVAQRARCGVTAEFGIPVEERSGRRHGAEVLDVHGQESGVVQHVDVAQPIVELDAVEHAGAVVEAEDVVGEQVRVPVDDVPGGDPIVEQRFTTGQEVVGQPFDLRRHAGVQHAAMEWSQLVEGGVPPPEQSVARSLGGDLRSPPRGGMESRQHPR
jgi:hypothetical protein